MAAGALTPETVLAQRGRNAPVPWRQPTPLGLDLYFFVPDSNPLTPAKVALGRRLSSIPPYRPDRSVACASCHRPDYAFSDTSAVSVGVFGRTGKQNAPTLLNVAYARSFFWDGRAETLEQQVLLPIQHPKEMDMTLDEAVWPLREEGESRRYWIRHRDRKRLLAFAGIWEAWTPPRGREEEGGPSEALESCALITVLANELVGRFQERMPAILEPDEWKMWLDPATDPAEAKALLRPYPAEELLLSSD